MSSTISNETLHGLVLSQSASSVGCAINSSLTDSVGRKLCSVILVTQEPKSTSLLSVTLMTVYTLVRNLMSSPASKSSSKDTPRAILVLVASLHWLKIIVIRDFLSVLSLPIPVISVLTLDCNPVTLVLGDSG